MTGALGFGQGLAGPKQGFGRHAAPVRALATDEFALHDRERQAAVSKAAGQRFSGDSTAETDDIKLAGHFVHSARRGSERRASCAKGLSQRGQSPATLLISIMTTGCDRTADVSHLIDAIADDGGEKPSNTSCTPPYRSAGP